MKGVQNVGRINKTGFYGGYGGEPLTKVRTLSRSFKTLEAAKKFAEGKLVTDIYMVGGKFKVEWLNVTEIHFDE